MLVLVPSRICLFFYHVSASRLAELQTSCRVHFSPVRSVVIFVSRCLTVFVSLFESSSSFSSNLSAMLVVFFGFVTEFVFKIVEVKFCNSK